MYLNILNYGDKKRFFALANRITNLDGNISDSEIELLESYRNEMNLIEVDNMIESDIDDIALGITDDAIVKKIVLFELISLACIDMDFSDSEIECLKHIQSLFNISDSVFDSFKSLSEEMIRVSNQISQEILSIE